jgi:hypothetical protein
MTVTWETLDAKMVVLLGTASDATDEERMEFWNMAQDFFAANHTAKQLKYTFAASGSSGDVVLPDDYIDLYAVYDKEENSLLQPNELIPGMSWDEDDDTSYRPRGYIEWPCGTVHLFQTPAADAEAVEVWYFGKYATVEDNADSVEVPAWAIEALLCYAAAASFLPKMADASFLNEYKTKVDQGNPIQNPLKEAHDTFLKRYEFLLKDRPRQVRRTPFKPGGRN